MEDFMCIECYMQFYNKTNMKNRGEISHYLTNRKQKYCNFGNLQIKILILGILILCSSSAFRTLAENCRSIKDNENSYKSK